MADALTGLRSIPDMSATDMSRWTEYQWLEEIGKKLRAELDEIVKGYGKLGGDTNIEEAISNLESALDGLYRRQCVLDEGE